jgi:hypothetical protein
MNQLIRILIQKQDSNIVLSNIQEFPPLKIFISHTKLDLENEPKAVNKLLKYLNAENPEKTWFDTGDIVTGSSFKTAIEQGELDTVLLAIVTDAYSSRAWCRRELLIAKQKQRPVVVVNAVQEREIRSFPYAGNTPVIRWNDKPQDAVDLLLQETLRHFYNKETLNKQKCEGDEIIPGSPELLTTVNHKHILYPDPPLGLEEAAVLETTGAQICTPLQRHALKNKLHKRLLVVALSVSQSEDLPKYGMRLAHLESAYLELSRYFLIAGIRLAYGGHLDDKSYTFNLADLLHEPTIEQLRGEVNKDSAPPAELINYIAWPTLTTDKDQARLGTLAEIRQCKRPLGISEKLDPMFVQQPPIHIPIDSPIRRFAWSRGLTEMRTLQTNETNARILIGGRVGQKEHPYEGLMPGILEEALLSIQAKRPIYLIGAFGGCARSIIDTIEGISREELTWKYQKEMPFSEELHEIYKEQKLTWLEYEEIVASLKASGYSGLNNGLTTEENHELAITRSVERMVELIFLGLSKAAK